jgi:hypothetical protein
MLRGDEIGAVLATIQLETFAFLSGIWNYKKLIHKTVMLCVKLGLSHKAKDTHTQAEGVVQ